MAAASSGDPGGSVNRRLPPYMDPTNQFGELTFLQLSGKDGVPLPKNPFIIAKSVELAAGGPIEGAKTEAQGTRYTLRIRDPSQVSKVLKMSKLVNGTEVVVEAHPNLNMCRCVISCYDIIEMEEKDVLIELLSQGVCRVHRITRNEGNKRVNTPALVLTFCKTTYPEHIKIGLLHVPTRPYFPNPMLCYGCFSYGHTRTRCPGPQRCFNCSGEHHGQEECSAAQFCRNCKDNHRPTSRQCPVYVKEKEIIQVKVRDNLSFPEARKRVEHLNKGTYAEAAAQQNEILAKLKELENKMKTKDDQIAELMQANKVKDETIARMRSHIQQLKQQMGKTENAHHSRDQTQASKTDKPHYSRDQSQTPQPTGPNTRSRNNSPAVQENKRGRPTKSNSAQFNKPIASPERQSPPPKKSATNPTIGMHYSDDDIEITDSQFFRKK